MYGSDSNARMRSPSRATTAAPSDKSSSEALSGEPNAIRAVDRSEARVDHLQERRHPLAIARRSADAREWMSERAR